MRVRWKIFYADGSTFCDQDGWPYDAPARGVQAIAQSHPDVGRTINCKEHYYWWTGERWLGGDQFGLFDYLVENGPRKVIFGRVLDNDNFRKVMQQLIADDYLPPKSARLPDERH